jgi:hypothetical protein
LSGALRNQLLTASMKVEVRRGIVGVIEESKHPDE